MGMNKIPTADALSTAAALTTADLAGSLGTATATLTATTTTYTPTTINVNFANVQDQLNKIGDDLAAIRTSSNAAVQHMIDDAT